MKPIWHITFRELARELHRFFIANTQNTAEEFYNQCIENPRFSTANPRLFNFGRDFEIRCLDPIHVFASICESGIWDYQRIDRLNLFFEILDNPYRCDSIDFSGCPFPFAIRIMAARKPESCAEIWKMFSRIMDESQDGLNDEVFNKLKTWYGIEISSLTIFLFWIDAHNFLPIDKNTTLLLKENNIIK